MKGVGWSGSHIECTALEVTTILGRESYDNVTGTSCATYSDFSIGHPISSNV